MVERSDYNRVPWRLAIGLVVLGLIAYPFDRTVSHWIVSAGQHLGGDVRRELEAWQQFGQAGWLVVFAIGFALVQPWRARRLLDLAAAAAVTWGVAFAAKLTIGRPRPKFDDPSVLLGPFGAYPVNNEAGIRHAWEFWAPISSDLWSMPSSHTAFAVMMAVFVSAMIPRLAPLVVGLAVLVGVSRVVFGAHYPSDVFFGAAVGLVSSCWVIQRSAGVRILDWVWARAIDRKAQPALPGLELAEREHGIDNDL